MNRLWVALLVGGLALPFGVGCNEKPTTQDKGEKLPAAGTDDGKAESPTKKPAINALSSEALVKEYLADPDATKAKYDDKEIVVRGVVEQTGEAPRSLGLRGAKDKAGKEIVLVCSFHGADWDEVKRVPKGATVVARGKFAYFLPEKNELCVDFCRLVKE